MQIAVSCAVMLWVSVQGIDRFFLCVANRYFFCCCKVQTDTFVSCCNLQTDLFLLSALCSSIYSLYPLLIFPFPFIFLSFPSILPNGI